MAKRHSRKKLTVMGPHLGHKVHKGRKASRKRARKHA